MISLYRSPLQACALMTAFAAVVCLHSSSHRALAAEPQDDLAFTTELDTVLEHDDGQFLWFHPRLAAVPTPEGKSGPSVVMTLQKHLQVSDFYSGLYTMRTDDGGQTWTGPTPIPELDWTKHDNGVITSVADVTPGYHAPTGKLIAIGAQVRYNPKGEQIEDIHRAQQTAYAVHDPKTGVWSKWQVVKLPEDKTFDAAWCACAQWLVEADGTLLLPFYHGPNATTPYSVTVMHCTFDGSEIKFVRHGKTIELNLVRGLVEPSLTKFQGRYYLTIRNDERGYVTTSDDGLNFEPIRPWTFDDGGELGSYNTQQHWITHGDGLFLAYTRKGANNDHVFRHRAPMFMAQVDTDKLHVIRATEVTLMPERGATLGNFGAANVSPTESWVTDAEGIFSEDARKRGATGALFLSRVKWNKPNEAFSTP